MKAKIAAARGEAPPPETGVRAAAPAADDAYENNYEEGGSSSKDAKKGGKKGKGKKGKEDELDITDGGGLQAVDEGTLKFAVCTGNLASRKDSKDVKIQGASRAIRRWWEPALRCEGQWCRAWPLSRSHASPHAPLPRFLASDPYSDGAHGSTRCSLAAFSISLFGKVLFEDQYLELTWGQRTCPALLDTVVAAALPLFSPPRRPAAAPPPHPWLAVAHDSALGPLLPPAPAALLASVTFSRSRDWAAPRHTPLLHAYSCIYRRAARGAACLHVPARRRLRHPAGYGLIGQNGSGKTTFLKCIATRQIPIPDFIDIWYLDKEAEPMERSAIDCVVDTVRVEKERLEKLEEDIMSEEGPEDPRLEAIYEKLDKMDPTTFDKRAGELLFGLGFSQTMMRRNTCDMSGGWRMRVALAQALFVRPMLLVLDEPTNHLDLGACVWLEDYLAKWDSILILTSHSADFLNGVCSKMYHLTVRNTLDVYGGNYESYVRTRQENEVNQAKRYEKEQDDIKHLKEFISSCGTYSNMVKQAQSKQKIIDKMMEAGLTKKVVPDPVFRFGFPNSEKIPPPVMAFQNVSFAYSGKKEVRRHSPPPPFAHPPTLPPAPILGAPSPCAPPIPGTALKEWATRKGPSRYTHRRSAARARLAALHPRPLSCCCSPRPGTALGRTTCTRASSSASTATRASPSSDPTVQASRRCSS